MMQINFISCASAELGVACMQEDTETHDPEIAASTLRHRGLAIWGAHLQQWHSLISGQVQQDTKHAYLTVDKRH